MSRGKEVWVVAEQRLGRLMDVSLELLGKAVELAEKLKRTTVAVLLGDGVENLAQRLIAHGAPKVYLLDDPALRLYQSDPYATLLSNLIKEHSPEVVLVPATNLGQPLAARIAARLRTGLTAHCIDLYIDEENGLLIQVVPGWGGNLMLKIVCPQKRPQMATVRPGVLARPEERGGAEGEVLRLPVSVKASDLRAQTLEMVEEEPKELPLEAAEVVVAGGWGMKALGGFGPVRELAQLLGGAVAGTRPAVDAGWIIEEALIGQSGKTVRPKLFISLGASGAMHFTTGFLKSGVILAVDSNPQAPIFEIADIGIVGDLREVLPCLIEELRAAKGTG